APLFVVDGFPMKDNGFLEEIKPEDITRISVWKDEQLATSLYGSDASNGLVVVTTKAAELKADTIIIGNGRDTVTAGLKGRLSTTLRGYQSAIRDYQTAVQGYQKESQVGQQEPGSTAASPFTPLFSAETPPDFNGALVIIDGKESTAGALRR